MAWIPISGSPPQFQNTSSVNYSGAVLKFYAAGTTTNISLAADSTGGTTAASVALNADGFPEISGNVVIPHLEEDYKLVLYPTQAAADSNTGADLLIDNISITTPASNQWTDSGSTPTFINATSFSVTGDQTSDFHVGRRLRTQDSGGTDYMTITASAYTTLTTITVSIDGAGTLDSGLSSVDFSILTATNSAIPSASISGNDWIFKGTTTHEGSTIQSEGAAVASATQPNIWSTDGDTIHITGTTQIDDFADAPQAGAWKKLIFDGALTLTHGSGITVQGAASYTTAAGDIAFIYADAVDAFRASIFKADGTPVTANVITNGTLQATTSGTAFNFTSIPSGTKRIKVMFNAVSLDGTDKIRVQIGDSGGLETSGYVGSTARNGTSIAALSAGFDINTALAARAASGTITLDLMDAATFLWSCSGVIGEGLASYHFTLGGIKALSAELTQVTITRSGTNSFDGGSVNISYEK